MVLTRRKPVAAWSMYRALHGDVSTLLDETELHFEFHEDDDDTGYIKMHDTSIMELGT
jgi:hypothetical protein